MSTLWQDFKYGLRQLRCNPGFTTVAILTLALGIGANTAIFSLVDEIWLRPRPVPHPERVVRIYTSNRTSEGVIAQGASTFPEFYYISHGVQTFSGVAFLQSRGALLDTGTVSKGVSVEVVSDNFFDVLAPAAACGHILTAAQAASPGALTVMLSYPFWNQQFSADRSLPGKTIILDRRHVTVAGILPRGFRGTEPLGTPAVWIPLSTWSELTGERPTPTTTAGNPYDLLGRLRAGVTLQQANAELATIAARLARDHPEMSAGRKMTCLRESQVQGEGLRHLSLLLLAISGLVLLIACANVASLLIARAEHRRHEFAMRLALGAGRRRLLRQLLTEAALLGAAATAAALLLGNWVDSVVPKLLPRLGFATTPVDMHITSGVVWFSVGAGLLSVFVFGGIPAWRGTQNAPADALKQHGRGTATRAVMRSALVVGQVAVSVLLVVCAGLLVVSLTNEESSNPGFDAHQNMLVMELIPAFAVKTQQAQRAFVEEARRHIEAIPGVMGTAVGRRIPFGVSGSGATRKVFFAGATGLAATRGIPIHYDPVSDNFFEMLGTRILRGRAIEARDVQSSAHVMVINQTMARRFWPGQNPVGQYVRLQNPNGDRYQVIGVAENSKNADFIENPAPYLYTPMRSTDYEELAMVVKTAGDPSAVADTVRRTLYRLNRDVPIDPFSTLREHVRMAMAGERTSAELIGTLGVLALLLASVGLYGLTSCLVGDRTQEIGVRMALGAKPIDVMKMMMGQGLKLVLIGVGIGIIGALGMTRFLASLLYGVKPTDPITFIAVSLILIAVALVACYIPARRASKVDPMVALRYE